MRNPWESSWVTGRPRHVEDGAGTGSDGSGRRTEVWESNLRELRVSARFNRRVTSHLPAIVRVLLVVAPVASAAAPETAPNATNAWHITMVDRGSIAGRYSSLALSPDGEPAITHDDDTHDRGKAATEEAQRDGWPCASYGKLFAPLEPSICCWMPVCQESIPCHRSRIQPESRHAIAIRTRMSINLIWCTY